MLTVPSSIPPAMRPAEKDWEEVMGEYARLAKREVVLTEPRIGGVVVVVSWRFREWMESSPP